jgi:inosose dehydratase
MKLGYPTITWGGVVGMPGGVTSVKDSFYYTAGSTADAFRDIAAAGYTGTEVFDGNLLEFIDEPQRFTHLLEDAGLTLVSVYTGANFIFDDIASEEMAKIEKAAAMAATFGAQRLVIGGGAQRVHGPADGDFQTPEALTKVMKLSGIHFCPDTAHLAGGGGNPAELIRLYGDRLAHVHLKDWDSRSQRFLPLGEGDLDFIAILQAIRETGYDDWLMVELDYYDGDPKTAAEISKRYLDKLLATKTS